MVELNQIARVIRSKNSGPFQLTFDIIFHDSNIFQKAKASGVLTPETFAELFHISMDQITTFVWFDVANAFKATIVRPHSSGSCGERDTYGAQQAAPLIHLEFPF
ncbi:DUF4387 domain-containing protein [Hominifimenecus sp. rT4P-3]|uniref:DUF4387 domain-containing protein n=1 Tax=Hominifimenecus sp. rT4P-3 TaxID=3242979 RepID=UPI003DA32DD7